MKIARCADDTVIPERNEIQLQNIDRLVEVEKAYGMKINIQKV